MNINRAGKQTKAYWKAENKAKERWEQEPVCRTLDYGTITQYHRDCERGQGFATGWIAGVSWARRNPVRPKKTKVRK